MDMAREQLQRVQRFIDNVTYKPGWEIRAERSSDHLLYRSSLIFIVVIAVFSDLTNPEAEPVKITSGRSFPAEMLVRMSDTEVIKHVIGRAVWELEQHEMHEWFKFDRFHVWDPHPEQKETRA